MTPMYETTNGIVVNLHNDEEDDVFQKPYYSVEETTGVRSIYRTLREVEWHLFCLQLGACPLINSLPPITKLEALFFHKDNDLTLEQMRQLKSTQHYAEMSEFGKDAFDERLEELQKEEKWKMRLTYNNDPATLTP